jgi:hypothetical protein
MNMEKRRAKNIQHQQKIYTRIGMAYAMSCPRK